jgi:magnesium transporter
MSKWIDLLDPTEEELRVHIPRDVDQRVVDEVLRPADPEGMIRPLLKGHGDYVFGRLIAAAIDPERDRLCFREIDVIVTREHLLTVRKTTPGDQPFDPAEVQEICAAHAHHAPGTVLYHLVNEIAEGYLDLLDDLDGEIDELERNLDTWKSPEIRRRVSELRHDLLRIRRTVAPTRDAVRGIADGRVDIHGGLLRREVFPEDVEHAFAGVLDKLLRATESLEFARDLLAAVRDYHATAIANEQNEIIKRLTVIAALVLFPTFLVGVYGQNFDHMPELHWHYGYLYSWIVIALVTFGQLAFFRWKKWI